MNSRPSSSSQSAERYSQACCRVRFSLGTDNDIYVEDAKLDVLGYIQPVYMFHYDFFTPANEQNEDASQMIGEVTRLFDGLKHDILQGNMDVIKNKFISTFMSASYIDYGKKRTREIKKAGQQQTNLQDQGPRLWIVFPCKDDECYDDHKSYLSVIGAHFNVYKLLGQLFDSQSTSIRCPERVNDLLVLIEQSTTFHLIFQDMSRTAYHDKPKIIRDMLNPRHRKLCRTFASLVATYLVLTMDYQLHYFGYHNVVIGQQLLVHIRSVDEANDYYGRVKQPVYPLSVDFFNSNVDIVTDRFVHGV